MWPGALLGNESCRAVPNSLMSTNVHSDRSLNSRQIRLLYCFLRNDGVSLELSLFSRLGWTNMETCPWTWPSEILVANCCPFVIQVKIVPLQNGKFEHQGIRAQLVGVIDVTSDRGQGHEFLSLCATPSTACLDTNIYIVQLKNVNGGDYGFCFSASFETAKAIRFHCSICVLTFLGLQCVVNGLFSCSKSFQIY